MLTFDEILREVFDRGAERRIDDAAEERATIERAQWGDQDATLALVFAYAPTLRALTARHAARLGVEDARSVAVSGLIEAIHAFRLDGPHDRLAGTARQYVADRMAEEDTSLVSVPTRTRKRFFTILRKAEAGADDLSPAELQERAREIAPEYEMSVETFDAIRQALVDNRQAQFFEGAAESLKGSADLGSDPSLGRLDAAAPIWAPEDSDAFRDADNRLLAARALEAIDGREWTVSRYAYGFVTGDPLSDGEVAQEVSLDELGRARVAAGESSLSRSAAQRYRTAALRRMRDAVAAPGGDR